MLFGVILGRKRKVSSPDFHGERAKLANMLAAVTGMRRGEIKALRFKDIGPDCLYVCGSWNDLDKIKLPKNNKTRTVEIPFPDLINSLVEQANQNLLGVSPNNFVLKKPLQGCYQKK